ncbi:MAG: RnfABCDGE type electron transport complex subunit D [Patescibacteria group bacterium]|nr:RnfABCDGE type electron transport complex subunit D [Patescibacteria group bacterium]
MYRLVLYYLILLLFVACVFSFIGILPYNPFLFIFSVLFLITVSWITNKIFANVFNAPTNVESVYISALILALIISPINSFSGLPLLFWAAVLTMASKYILAINKKHIFNPVAIAVVLTAFGFRGSVSWWIGTASMLPFSLLGLLIVRKIKRYDLVFYFFSTSLLIMLGFNLIEGNNLFTTLKQIILFSPIFFFAFVMLTEPLTTPPTKKLQSIYAVLVGVLFTPQFHIGSFYTTPELSLVIGNAFSYLVSPKDKIISAIRQKIQIAPDMVDFFFIPKKKLAFIPGQYMEWTLPHKNPDSRGNRRYFTIASSPTEEAIRLGVRFYPNGSSYKKAMLAVGTDTPFVGAQLAGDFTLPKNINQKLIFIAGGIGITPFRSMIKYLIDIKEHRPIILFYVNRTIDEIVYRDVFDQAQEEGIKIVYALTDQTKLPPDWKGAVGRIDTDMITQAAPDFRERIFYLSGPRTMVTAYEETLKKMGIKENKIKTDFFPGFA